MFPAFLFAQMENENLRRGPCLLGFGTSIAFGENSFSVTKQ